MHHSLLCQPVRRSTRLNSKETYHLIHGLQTYSKRSILFFRNISKRWSGRRSAPPQREPAARVGGWRAGRRQRVYETHKPIKGATAHLLTRTMSLWLLSGAVGWFSPLMFVTITIMTLQAHSWRAQLPWGWGFIKCWFNWLSGSLFQKSLA